MREPDLHAAGPRAGRRTQGITVVNAVMACLALVVGLQWVLVSAAVEAFRAGRQALLVTSMVLSALCFASSWWLARFAGETAGPEDEG